MSKTRWLLVALCGVLVLTLSGCGPKVYNNGTYKGVSQADDHGFAVAQVVVEKDKIVSVELFEMTELGVLKDYDTYPYEPVKEANREMAKRFVGRKDADVDAFAGATSSSNKYKEAVSFALEKAKKSPDTSRVHFQGTFFGRSPDGPQGYGMAWVSIEDDKIVQVRLEDVTEDGELKDWLTYAYPKALEAKKSMEKRFVQENEASVDTFAGATRSSTAWVQAVTDALNNARIR